MFYEFMQNNSGGSFDIDEEKGITHHVVIEADDKDNAVFKAEQIGLYFDGVGYGADCYCCGDRWNSEPYCESTKPTYYGEELTVDNFKKQTKWMKSGFELCIHYADGRKEWW